ncbi:hypothetical protein PIB30_037505 [Stylosanthes scabra]|uniref:Uncharacterized protein n=1 Tax=Stylosanthes scabra TaxID=79078 RepID=A0ABU6YC49_9FABA|nr:hypothetical protein [Stylosanthes scabra]
MEFTRASSIPKKWRRIENVVVTIATHTLILVCMRRWGRELRVAGDGAAIGAPMSEFLMNCRWCVGGACERVERKRERVSMFGKPLIPCGRRQDILKLMSQGATKILSRTQVVLLRKRKGKSVFDWGWLQLSCLKVVRRLKATPPKRNLRYIRYQLAVSQTNPQFRVQLTFGAGVAWSSCLSPRLPRVTRCHWYNPAVTMTSCALAKYGASDLCPRLTNSVGSPLSPGQTCYH